MATKTNALKTTTATEAARTARTNKHTAASKAEAMQQAQEILRAPVSLDEHSTARAGYPVYRTEDSKAWVSDLNTRFEVNTARGASVNIWIVEAHTDSAATDAAAQRVADAAAQRSKARDFRAQTDAAATTTAAQQAAALKAAEAATAAARPQRQAERAATAEVLTAAAATGAAARALRAAADKADTLQRAAEAAEIDALKAEAEAEKTAHTAHEAALSALWVSASINTLFGQPTDSAAAQRAEAAEAEAAAARAEWRAAYTIVEARASYAINEDTDTEAAIELAAAYAQVNVLYQAAQAAAKRAAAARAVAFAPWTKNDYKQHSAQKTAAAQAAAERAAAARAQAAEAAEAAAQAAAERAAARAALQAAEAAEAAERAAAQRAADVAAAEAEAQRAAQRQAADTDTDRQARAEAATEAAQHTAAERAAEAAEIDAATAADTARAARPYAYMVYTDGQTEARRIVTTQTAAQIYTETGARLVRRVILTDAEAAEAAEARNVKKDKAAHRRGKVSTEAARRVYAQQLQAADYEAIARRVVYIVLKRGDAYSNGEVFAKLLRAPWTDARKEDLTADARAALFENATEDTATQYAAMFAAVNHTVYKNRAPYDRGAVYVTDWATFEVQNAAACISEMVKNPASALRQSWSAFMAELTQQQRNVLRYTALGYSTRQTATAMRLKSVKKHLFLMRKKAAKYPARAAVMAQQQAAEAHRRADNAQTVTEAAEAHKAEAAALRKMRAALAVYQSVTRAQTAAEAESAEDRRAAKQADRQAAQARRAAEATAAERAAEAERAAQRQAERAATAAARAERAQRRTRAAQNAAKQAAERAAARYMDR